MGEVLLPISSTKTKRKASTLAWLSSCRPLVHLGGKDTITATDLEKRERKEQEKGVLCVRDQRRQLDKLRSFLGKSRGNF